MTSEFIQAQIQRLLAQASDALDRLDWDEVRARAEAILRFDPENADAKALLAAAGAGLTPVAATNQELTTPAQTVSTTSTPVPKQGVSDEPTSFANGRYLVKRFLGEGGKKKVFLAAR